jgi:uncharacterized protein YjbI with pentapeptide repeats
VSVSLEKALLTGTVFVRANLSGANLKDSTVSGVINLSNANLTGANLYNVNLTAANVSGVTWSNTLCPDGTNSNANGGTCVGHLAPPGYIP